MSDVATKSKSESDIVIDPGAAVMRSAYILGRNTHLLEGWLEAVGEIAGDRPERPWKWDYPYTLFGDSYDAWPEHLYTEIDASLRTLVLAQVVDHAALVELRRLLDSACEECGNVAEFASADLSEDIIETQWYARSSVSSARQFGECLLRGAPERLPRLRRLGSQIGELLNRLALGLDYEPYTVSLRKTAALSEELFPPETPQLDRLRDQIPTAPPANLAETWASCSLLVACLQELDCWILEQAPLPKVSVELYIVLDDRQQTLTFLDVEIPFAEFAKANALAGLEILRVLIQRPQRPMTASNIIELVSAEVRLVVECIQQEMGPRCEPPSWERSSIAMNNFANSFELQLD